MKSQKLHVPPSLLDLLPSKSQKLLALVLIDGRRGGAVIVGGQRGGAVTVCG